MLRCIAACQQPELALIRAAGASKDAGFWECCISQTLALRASAVRFEAEALALRIDRLDSTESAQR